VTWRAEDPQGHESLKIKWELVPYIRGKHWLDLGCGDEKVFKQFIGVDNGHHAKEFGWKILPDISVESCESMPLLASGQYDLVFSSHLLEHIEDYKSALKEWWRLVKPNGYLALYLPHKKLYPNIGENGANPDHKHDFVPEDIITAMQELPGWDLLENQERSAGTEYSFFQVYKKVGGKHCRRAKPVEGKKACVVRYGAFGDIIMASSVFPGLKEQGYHVTLYTVPSAYEVVKHDPHIDHVVLQITDIVPNEELQFFWLHLEQKYDKFINLSESVEGAWLPVPSRVSYHWPDEIRRKYFNKNYIEFAHELAGVPLPPKGRFYPTVEERHWARKNKDKMEGRVVLFSLSGSAVHKTWPHIDMLFARILHAYEDVKIITVGDKLCQILETGWMEEPRVIRRSGEWSIRESMSFCEVSDLIIGPETGLLNAAGMLEAPKICLLSHSTSENLTKHWLNTVALTPEMTPCYPCHRMHYGFKFCHQDSHSKQALCMVNITVPQVWKEVVKFLGKPDVDIPEEIEPTLVLHDSKAQLRDQVANALG
jgi:ADP-heptose:LPS heptosyltransferase/predicted SAM-dependent methyltransferase